MTYIRDAISLALERPELVPFEYWLHLENGSRYELISRAMPVGATWFMKPTPELPFEAGRRAASTGGMSTASLEALLNEAPYDDWLLSLSLRPGPRDPAYRERVWKMVDDRLDYDLRVLQSAINWSQTKEARLRLQRKACSLAVNECLSLSSQSRSMPPETSIWTCRRIRSRDGFNSPAFVLGEGARLVGVRVLIRLPGL